MAEVEINERFNTAVAFVNQTNRNIFLTGKAGTGKTTFLKYIKQNCYKNMVVLASTGVAAINAGGVTIHSFFQLPFGMYVPENNTYWQNGDNGTFNRSHLLSKLRFNRTKLGLIRELELLIIDEVSMVRADLMDAIDDLLRIVRRRDEPFGGVQMVFIGDLFQLPPVLRQEEEQTLYENYKSPFFFDARVLAENPLTVIELNKIYRQNDEEFIDLLNKVRNNQCKEDDIEFLNSFCQPDYEIGYNEEVITLTSHNAIADQINKLQLENLKGKTYSFEAKVQKEFPERSYPAEFSLQLKEGAQIMFIKNDTGENRRYYNGKLGTIDEITPSKKIRIKFKDEVEPFELTMEKWSNIRYNFNSDKDAIEEEEIGTFEQFPIRLAWAVTIHKSQGLTFDKAIIDAGRSFAAGQVYVALSRLRTLQGLVLRSYITPQSISTDQNVLDFMHVHAQENLAELLEVEKKNFIGASLMRTFDFGKLNYKLHDHQEAFMTKKMPDQELFVRKAKKVWDACIEQDATGRKFMYQLGRMVQAAETEGFEKVKERVDAGAEWFTKAIDEDVLEKCRKMMELANARKNTLKYRKELTVIINDFERKKLQLKQAKSMVDGLCNHKSLDDLSNQLLESKKSQQVENNKSTYQPKPSNLSKVDTREVSLQLYEQGKSIEEIATERGLKAATIETHLMQFLDTGKVDLKIFIDPKEAEIIISFLADKAPEFSSKDIYLHFQEKYSYAQIRAVRTWHTLQLEKLQQK